MEQTTPLKAWIDEKGYTFDSLAKELEYSYEYIFKIATGKDRRGMSTNFKLRFIEHFGWEEAGKLFDTRPILALMPTTEVAQ